MGLRGPRRKANSEQIALGDPGKRARRRQAKEDATTSGASSVDVMTPVMPNYLVKEAVEHWNFIVPQLSAAGVIRAIDVDLLGEYCQCMGKALKYERYCKRYGDFVQKSAATKVARPELKLIREFRDRANKLADKLGLNPKARQAMGIKIVPPPTLEEQSEDAELAAIINRR